MRRSAWIFFASIFLPSLGLAWLAFHSARDQQVVLEHQQAIICQNITDALAKSVQARMDEVRGDFVKSTQQLLADASSPQTLAINFNRKLCDAWPLAEIGFAVNLNGEIYSPTPFDSAAARTFRDENDRFLSNRENVEVYSSNSVVVSQNAPVENGSSPLFADRLKEATGKVLDQAISNEQSKLQQQNEDLLRKDVDKQTLHAAINRGVDLDQITTQKTLQAPVQDISSLNTAPFKSAAEMSRAKAVPTATDSSQAPTDTAAGAGAAARIPAASTVTTTVTAAPAPPAEPAASAATTASMADAVAAIPPPAAPASDTAADGKAVPAVPLSGSVMAPASIPVNATPASSGELQNTTTPIAPISQATTINTTGGAAGFFNSNAALSNNSISNANSANLTFGKVQRQVIPQQMFARDTASLSSTVPEESDFRRVIGSEASGELARFLEDKMRLLVWSHAAADAPIVFGAQLDPGKLVETLKGSLQIPELSPDSYSRSSGSDTCVAILDDTGKPVVLSRPDFKGDWKHPFVATEIGEVLPHWEAALYLVDPQQISRTARTLQLTFGLIVLFLGAAIAAGGSLIGADVRRQVRLAQQKTDFVSNVSHELKTPLTSIRMFADLLAEKRVPDEERQATYLRIIAAEASRLTRLINNVLDFARLERGVPAGEPHACDLVEAVRDVVETCGPHLEGAGITFQCEIEAESLPIRGDRDALAQIILNLISNAEKYGGQDILVRVRRQEIATGALGCVDVLDRGAGIPAREAKTIFEPFHRLDDSLSSGIPGSGLGLTLARRMARAHNGDVTYSPRAGGGSCFTLTVPLATDAQS